VQTKSSAERTFEALTWAAVVIWLGFILVINAVNASWLILMVLGIIFLSSAIYQRSRNWETSLSIWIFGIWMAVFSVIEIVNEIVGQVNGSEGLNITLGVYLGIALVSMGVAAILRMIQGPRVGRNVPSNVNVDYDRYGSGSAGGRESYGPREYDAGRTYSDGQGYSAQQSRAAYDDPRAQPTRDPRDRGYDPRAQPARNPRDRGYDPRAQPAPDPRDRGYDPRAQPPRDPRDPGYDPRRAGGTYGSSDPYNDQTQYAEDDYGGYQSQPVDDRGYDPRAQPARDPRQRGYQDQYQNQPQDQYAYDDGNQDDVYDDYDYYEEPEWDAAPQVQQQQPPRQRRRRPVNTNEPSDLESRVEDIIRRSRERRSGAAQAGDMPPDDLPY
jgi:hypothetical protein